VLEVNQEAAAEGAAKTVAMIRQNAALSTRFGWAARPFAREFSGWPAKPVKLATVSFCLPGRAL
jgi:hypothetical protein